MTFMAVGGAVIGGGLSLLAARENNKAASRGTTSTSTPWKGQQQHLVDGFAGANAGWKDAITTGTYQGDRVANFNSMQTGGASQILGNVNGQQAMGQNVQNMGFRNAGGINSAAMNAGSLYNKAGQNATGQIISNGAQFAQNPYMDQMVDAASRDVTRNLNENQMTSLDLASTGSGNMNSSRTGVAEGIMKRGAADRIGDISAGLRGSAYQNGMGMAQDQYNTGMNAQLQANTQLLDTGKTGLETIGMGQGMMNSAQDMRMALGDKWQQQDQAEINGAKAAWDEKRTDRLNQSAAYLGAVQGNYGGSTTQQGQQQSMIGALGGGIMGGMGMGMNIAQMQARPQFSPTTPVGIQGGYNSMMNGFGANRYGGMP